MQEDGKLLLWFALLTLPIMISFLALQKDLGTAYGFYGYFSWSGINRRYLLADYFASRRCCCLDSALLWLFLIPGGKEFLYHHMGVDTHQINRLSAWLNPFDYADSIAYQQTQGMISIGSGGLFGKGFNIVELPVPVRESGYDFYSHSENFGFIGGSIVLALYLILIYRMLRVTFCVKQSVLYLYFNWFYYDDSFPYF